MSSFLSKIVKNLVKIGTFRYRKHHLSLSRNIKLKNTPYHPKKNFDYKIIDIQGTKVEVLEHTKNCNNDFAIVQFHGGGHTQSMNNLYRKIAEKLSKTSACPVYSIDYKSSSEFVYPKVHNEVFDCYCTLINTILRGKKVIVIGDSFGANLMLSTLLKMRDKNMSFPIGIICISCYIDLAATGDSYKENCYKDPSYSLPRNQKFEENEKYVRRITPYCGGTSPFDCLLSPAYAEYHGFPQMLIQCGEIETAASDNDMLYAKCLAANVKVQFTKYEGMWHDFQYFTPFLKECKLAWKEIDTFISTTIKNHI